MAGTQRNGNSGNLPTVHTTISSRATRFFQNVTKRKATSPTSLSTSSDGTFEKPPKERSTLGILTDPETDEVPGTVMLLSPTRNEPLGIQRMERHKDDAASIRSRRSRSHSQSRTRDESKRTPDGKIVLNPQPEDTPNDPLNWPAWRRDCALLSLGFYCMLGGGMTPILAAGFNNVASTFDVTYARVALTTGLYMMGLGVGSVIFSPTAILYGKRTVYLGSSILFILSTIWCALAPNYANLVVARVFQGIAVSPVECLPSATIAEIFFLHERAFRVGIYTLLLLGGKNLIPLVSAAIIQAKGWRWVFWIVAIAVGFGGSLLFFFNPETFWDRTPRPRKIIRMMNESQTSLKSRLSRSMRPNVTRRPTDRADTGDLSVVDDQVRSSNTDPAINQDGDTQNDTRSKHPRLLFKAHKAAGVHFENDENMPHLHNLNSPYYSDLEKSNDYFGQSKSTNALEPTATTERNNPLHAADHHDPATPSGQIMSPALTEPDIPDNTADLQDPKLMRYTTGLRQAPPLPYLQTLKPYNGRLSDANWFLVAMRPFVLYAYPSVLWSSMVYALSVGWLIVLSESVSNIYRNKETYNFSAIGTGLVYISPFIGGVLGTAVAGKFSDVIVRFMARRNGGIYEPEFRLVMAIPIALCTAIGLMGFGWSAEEHDNWIVPTVFFGIISFGCCIGSTTSITFVVDSYRQFAGEALVTLNFSKNILHGLIWSLFFPQWLESDGPKTVFLAIGGIQLACMLFTIPMYIYGKRARMWTVRKRMMERF